MCWAKANERARERDGERGRRRIAMATAFADDRHPKHARHRCADRWEDSHSEGCAS